MLNKLIIYQKTYEFLLELYKLVRQFPKSEKYVLGQRLENTIINIIENIIEANMRIEKEKLPFLTKANVELEKVRIYLKLSKDLGFLSIKQYKTMNSKLREIGRLLGGLIKKFGRARF